MRPNIRYSTKLVTDEAEKLKLKEMIDFTARQDPGNVKKLGQFTGKHALHPFNGAKVPIWIGNFVLMGYGTGAIMAVPAHDERDFEFCREYGIPVTPVIRPVDGTLGDTDIKEPFLEYGIVENSGEWSGLASADARKKMAAFAQAKGFGNESITYRIKDWGISRQRYWGTPIPMVYCANVRHRTG